MAAVDDVQRQQGLNLHFLRGAPWAFRRCAERSALLVLALCDLPVTAVAMMTSEMEDVVEAEFPSGV